MIRSVHPENLATAWVEQALPVKAEVGLQPYASGRIDAVAVGAWTLDIVLAAGLRFNRLFIIDTELDNANYVVGGQVNKGADLDIGQAASGGIPLAFFQSQEQGNGLDIGEVGADKDSVMSISGVNGTAVAIGNIFAALSWREPGINQPAGMGAHTYQRPSQLRNIPMVAGGRRYARP